MFYLFFLYDGFLCGTGQGFLCTSIYFINYETFNREEHEDSIGVSSKFVG
jgi:hypothetical protein